MSDAALDDEVETKSAGTSAHILVRPVTENDLPAVRDLFYRSYGANYPYKEFYNDEWLKRSIYNESYLFLLAQYQNIVVGSASVYYEVGVHADLCGEFGRLVVNSDYRSLGVGSALMQARLDFANKRLHFGFSECRTAHPYAQRISEKHGLRPIGFLPQKVLLEKRESLVLMGKVFTSAIKLRRNNPRVIPEIFLLGQLALQNLGIDIDLIAAEDVESYPIGTYFEAEELNELDLSTLLRIERGRLTNRLVFGNLQLTYGLFQLQARNSSYLVARQKGNIVGAIGFTFDPIGRILKVLELIDLRDDVAGFLLKELDRRAREQYQAEYVEITVSAYAPIIQRTLSHLGFLPVAYCPSFVFDRYERLDTVKMAKLYVPLDIDQSQLTEESGHVYALVRMGFEERRMGLVVHSFRDKMLLFNGLEEGEINHIATLCHLVHYKAGELILQEGAEARVLYMVKEGVMEVWRHRQPIAQIGAGDCIGEISLVMQTTYTATVLALTDVELVALRHDEFENLINRFPRIGLQVMRNISISLGQKLGQLQLILTRE